jgi:hypothetical protein
MRTVFGHFVFWVGCLAAATLLSGCGGLGRSERSADAKDEADLGRTIASLGEVGRPEPAVVEGYGLVGGLPGTGSSICPTGVRAYLKRYVLAQLSNSTMNLDALIDSDDTAVVQLVGLIPAVVSKGEHFDVRVRPVDGSDVTSLRGGWLYEAELRSQGASQVQSRAMATVEGAVFVNLIETTEPVLTDGYVLGGGVANYDYRGTVRLRRAGYEVASTLRNRLNERYSIGTAQAVSARGIDFVIPPQYQRRKARFVSMVAATYLTETPELLEKRIDFFVPRLSVAESAERSEIALEAIGRNCLPKLATLLDAPSEEVRLRVARCMLNMGDDRGWEPLRTIALDAASTHRLEALDAIATGARRNEALALARRLLRDSDVRVILAAYEHLRQMEDAAIQQEFVGRRFYLEQVVQTDRKAIFVSRSGDPRIVVFGGPLRCRDSLFIESQDGQGVVDSRQGRDYASLSRRMPGQGVVGQVCSGLALSEIVRVLATERPRARDDGPGGLGVSYSDVTAVLEQLSAKEGVAAEFWAGPLPKIGLLVKK